MRGRIPVTEYKAVKLCRQISNLPRTPKSTSAELQSLLQAYVGRPPRPVPLSQLLSFGSPLTPESVLSSASYVLSEIPRRLYQRVRAFDEKIPFIVGTNPFIARTHQLFRNSFQALATYPPVKTLDDNLAFSRRLEGLVQSHSNDIPTLSKGFQECSRYMTIEATSAFLDDAIKNRISDRLIAEQHIALSRALESFPESRHSSGLGIVNPSCSPAEMVRMCGSFVHELCEATLGSAPDLEIEGGVESTFAYVPVHIEYILTEILKNSFRATVENHALSHSSGPNPSPPPHLPPVTITISPSRDFLSLRIRDEGGGISPQNIDHIFSYAFTTAGRDRATTEDGLGGGPYAAQAVGGSAAFGVGSGDGGAGEGNMFGEIMEKGLQTGLGTIAGLGYGLPMARLYAQYFGGNLELMSLYGHGTDVFIKLRRLDQGGNVKI